MINKVPPRDRLELLYDDDFHVALLHLAIKHDDILAIKDLMRVPNWIHEPDKGGRNALHWAVAFGTKDVCELLLSHNSEGIHHHDKIGRTPLHFAAIWGRSDVAKLILGRGAQVNAPDRKGMTALHYAAQNSNPFLIRSLIKRGANKQAKDSRRRTPYQVAVQWGSPAEILDLLDPDFDPDKVHRSPDLPQAQRFAASLSPTAFPNLLLVAPPMGSSSNKDFPAELIKYEMQKQVDKTRTKLQKVVAKRMRKWDPPAARSKEYALKALAARRKKMVVEQQKKKTDAMKRRLQTKTAREVPHSAKSSGRSSPPSLPSSPRFREPHSDLSSVGSSVARRTNTDPTPSTTRDGTISKTGSKTSTKSSRSTTTALKRSGPITRGQPAPTFSRPNSPNSSKSPYSPQPLRPNPAARYGLPGPPVSIRATAVPGKGASSKYSSPPSKAKIRGRIRKAPIEPKWPMRTPSPARLALSEFVGTSARHNALGKYPSPAVHQCIDVHKLQKQWL